MKRVLYTKKNIIIILLILLMIGLILITQNKSEVRTINNKNTFSVSPEILNQKATIPSVMRLSEGLIPATNRWFSSLIFGETQTIYAYPFSYKTKGKGFEVGIPKITSSENTVFGLHNTDIIVGLSSNSHEVSRYDDISVDNIFKDESGEKIATVTIAQGHPFVYLRGNKKTEVSFELVNLDSIEWIEKDKAVLFRTNNQSFGIKADSIRQTTDKSFSVNLLKDDHITIMAIPNNTNNVQEYIKLADNQLESTKVEVRKLTDKFDTTYKLELQNDRDSILGLLPHHNQSEDNSELGSFDTLYGQLKMHKGREFKYEHITRPIPTQLDLSAISEEQREKVKLNLANDSKTLTLNKTDSYFGSKELYRAANLLQLAYQLNETEIAMSVQEKLKTALNVWLSPYDGRANRYFYYDNNLKGVVGIESSFGSEEFNDHHFHYGYFIYAASILAEHDSDFLSENKDTVNLLIADIAAPDGVDNFPPLRTYDRFTGHSWASGYGNFLDGNNQESSSEAVNAWAAVYRWAKVINNEDLEETAQWLYTNEVEATMLYWLNDQRDQKGFGEFTHTFVSLVWQGKRDFATFFSPRPQAALGIQLIPMSPAHIYLSGTDIQKNISSVIENQDNYSGQFGDYLIMYKALNNSDKTQNSLENINENNIDDANSYSYLYAWVYSQSSRN
jgi:endo-1,3(4)-beta-glucanase